MTSQIQRLSAKPRVVLSALRQRARRRPEIGHLGLNLLVAAWMLGVLNAGFWDRLAAIFAGAPFRGALFGGAIFALTVLVLELLGPGRLQKPAAAALLLVAAAAGHYERTFGVLIDREMVRNLFGTTATEARHLITPTAVTRIALTGLLPAALVFWLRVRRVGRWHQLWRWPLGVAVSFALLAGGLMLDFKAFSSVLRKRQDLMGAYQPGASLVAFVKYAREELRAGDPVLRRVATDAAPGPALAAAGRPVLLVLFVGETLRAQNFGLNGYARDTTPGLRARNVVNFPLVTACGTSTAVSVPCMFSPLARADYSRRAFLSQENLLDLLVRAGFDVIWHDNNSGDQNVARRTGWQPVDAALSPQACAEECTDAVFLPLIEEAARGITRNTVLVLHMIGNHGPAYHLRYPQERARFLPDCRTAEFALCTREQIVNAYDNAVLETDRVLSRSIDILAASDRVLPAMLYVSDHGESLGENGLWLHAAPWFMAPEEQIRVPMVLWLGGAFRSALRLDAACLRRAAQRPASHDNLFHTVPGLLDIVTAARDPALDLTAGCRRPEMNG